jgi:hypothetical protein
MRLDPGLHTSLDRDERGFPLGCACEPSTTQHAIGGRKSDSEKKDGRREELVKGERVKSCATNEQSNAPHDAS